MLTAEPEEVSTEANPRLRWSVSSAESEVVVSLDGELDLATVEPLGRLLGEIVERRPTTITVDVARLSFLDSTGIHCLVNAAQTATRVDCRLVLRRPSATVVRILGICGVDEFLLGDADSDTTARR
jgi:anti-sigma B factor antagonist